MTNFDLANDLSDAFADQANDLADLFLNQPATDPGMYRTKLAVYRVVISGSGHPYAKRLNASGIGFAYDAGAIHGLKATDRMTLAEAKALGLELGACCVCGRELSDPVSVANGIGPVCAKRV